MSFNLTVGFDEITCWKCGIIFGVPTTWNSKRHEDHETFWCPNGHGAVFAAKSQAEILGEKLARMIHYHEQAQAALRDAGRKLKRVASGICPCCNRSFKQVARHMAAKHKNWSPA